MIKNEVLCILKKNEGYVSGESISRMLNISRMSVSNAVKSLIIDGYVISASTKKGYKLEKSPNLISIGELSTYLDSDTMQNVIYLEEVSSTNDYLKNLASNGAKEGTVVIANRQTAGKGRLGRNFYSPENVGIYMSYLYRPTATLSELSSITSRVAVAVCQTIQNTCGVECKIKWVNDLLINDKKVCGILTELSVVGETLYADYVVVGIGINVNNPKSDFNGELRDKATSIKLESGREHSRSKLVAEIIKNLKVLFNFSMDKCLSEYRKLLVNTNREAMFDYQGKQTIGLVLGIDDDFSLLVKVDDKTIKLSSGVVSIRGRKGYL